MARTLADMTPEEREQCVGMWCDLETNKGTQQVVLYRMIEEHETGPVAYRLSFTSRHEILGFDPGKLTPRFDLPRAWEPDGTPSYDDIETAEVSLGHVYFDGSERVKFPDGTTVCRFVGEWWERKDTH